MVRSRSADSGMDKLWYIISILHRLMDTVDGILVDEIKNVDLCNSIHQNSLVDCHLSIAR